MNDNLKEIEPTYNVYSHKKSSNGHTAKNILVSAKENANDIIKELNEMYSSADTDNLKKANKLRDKLNKNLKDTLDNSENTETDNAINIDNLSIGQEVLVKPFNMYGTILKLPNKNNEVFVQFGNTKTNIKLSNIELVDKKACISNAKKSRSKLNTFNKAQSISTEINVIGQTVDEAIFVIDKYLDDCYLAGLKSARIVHGKGTGKLRKGIHEFLRTHPHVSSFRLGTYGEGEMGVTIVELK